MEEVPQEGCLPDGGNAEYYGMPGIGDGPADAVQLGIHGAAEPGGFRQGRACKTAQYFRHTDVLHHQQRGRQRPCEGAGGAGSFREQNTEEYRAIPVDYHSPGRVTEKPQQESFLLGQNYGYMDNVVFSIQAFLKFAIRPTFYRKGQLNSERKFLTSSCLIFTLSLSILDSIRLACSI